jgi:hypothetical protein
MLNRPEWTPRIWIVQKIKDSEVVGHLVGRFGSVAWLLQHIEFYINHDFEFIRAAIVFGYLDFKSPNICMMYDPKILSTVSMHPIAKNKLIPRGFLHSIETTIIAENSGYQFTSKTLRDACYCRDVRVIEHVLARLKNKTSTASIKLNPDRRSGGLGCDQIETTRALVKLIEENPTRLIPAYGALGVLIHVVDHDTFRRFVRIRFETSNKSGCTHTYEARVELKEAIRHYLLECAMIIIDHAKVDHLDVLHGFRTIDQSTGSPTIVALQKLYDDVRISYTQSAQAMIAAEQAALESFEPDNDRVTKCARVSVSHLSFIFYANSQMNISDTLVKILKLIVLN